jgi:hypothetical protein
MITTFMMIGYITIALGVTTLTYSLYKTIHMTLALYKETLRSKNNILDQGL